MKTVNVYRHPVYILGHYMSDAFLVANKENNYCYFGGFGRG